MGCFARCAQSFQRRFQRHKTQITAVGQSLPACQPASPPAFQLSSRVHPCYPCYLCATHRSVTARVCVAVRASIFRVLALTSPLQFFLPWRALQSAEVRQWLHEPTVSEATMSAASAPTPARLAHSEGQTTVCYSSDGSFIFTAGADNAIRKFAGVADEVRVCVTEVVPALSPSSHPACAQLGSRTLVTIVLDQLVNMWHPTMVATAYCCRERCPPYLHPSNRRRVS
jgi:hypothetical protein